MKRLITLAIASAAVAVLAAGCGGGGSGGGSAATFGGASTPAAANTSAGAAVAVRTTKLGPTNGKPQAQHGISAAKLGTTKRQDGKTEATYAGHPLYCYVSDTKPGRLSGEGLDQFGAVWDAVAPSGRGIDKG